MHIYFGKDSGPKYDRRVNEIDSVAKFLKKRAQKDDRNHILVGDFNIKSEDSSGANMLKKNGFQIFQNDKGSNKDQTKFYDQISFLVRDGELIPKTSQKSKGVLQFFDSIFRTADFGDYKDDMKKIIRDKVKRLKSEQESISKKLTKNLSDTSRIETEKKLTKNKNAIKQWRLCLKSSKAGTGALRKYYLKEWRTFHASDHLPLWVELRIDFSDEYLDNLI